jgi:hypothetical protein
MHASDTDAIIRAYVSYLPFVVKACLRTVIASHFDKLSILKLIVGLGAGRPTMKILSFVGRFGWQTVDEMKNAI